MVQLRSFPVCVLVSLLLCGSASISQQPAPATRIVDPIDESRLVTLGGSVHPLATAANDRGAVSDNMPLERMHLVLKRSASQESALRQLIGEMHTPGSASYHKWLTPDDFGKQFGPADQDIAAVQAWLGGHGFNVVKVNPGKQTIEFSGNASQLSDAFHAQIHQYQVNGETHYANATDPQIPAALAPVVGGFVSLNNFRLKHYSHILGKAAYNSKTDQATPEWTQGNSSGVNFVLSPGDYAVQYDLNPLYAAGTNGSGQTIAIVNESNINIDLVNQFRSLFNLPANPPQVIIDGNDPGIDGINNPYGLNYASGEAYLDVEWAGAVAPNATVDLVIAGDTAVESGLFLAAEHAVYGNVAPIVSLSFGECEQYLLGTNSFLNQLWEQAAAQGITVLVSAGDGGPAGCDNFDIDYYAVEGLAVSGFASTPYNVAVGGTDFYYSDYATGAASISNYWTSSPSQLPAVSLLKQIPEQPWNDSQYGLNAINLYNRNGETSIVGGSGGASSSAVCSRSWTAYSSCTGTVSGYPKPAWQTGAGVPNDSVRDIPDVSLFAANGQNYSFYPMCAEDGDCQAPSGSGQVQITGTGGTSASAPAFAGIMALVNQRYGRQGQANFVLYPLKAQFPAAFHDVTRGTNSVPCNITNTSSGYTPKNCIAVANPVTVTDPYYGKATEGQIGTGTTPDYNAAAGYNLATGLGTVDASQLVTNWGSVRFASTTTTLTPSSTSFTHGTSISVSGTVTTASGTPTGNVGLVTDSMEPAAQSSTLFALSGGSFTGANINWLPGGTYNIWGQYGGDSKNGMSASAKTQVTVSPENSGIFLRIYATRGTRPQTITSSGATVPYGTQLLLSAEVTPSSDLTAYQNAAAGLSSSYPVFQSASGAVTFKDGSTPLSTALVNASSEAEYTATMALNAGSHSVTASYSGDTSYNASTAAAITLNVTQVAPSVYITAPQQLYSQGQAFVLTVLVGGDGPGAAPSGTVTLTGAPSGTPSTATLTTGSAFFTDYVEGVATFVIPATAPAGTYTIGATYTPDSASSINYTTASTSGFGLTITSAQRIATTITASASPGTTSPTALVTLSGTVTAASGTAPTGSVYFFLDFADSGYAIEAYFLENLIPGSGASSTFSGLLSSQSLPQGTDLLTVYYGGSGTDAPSSTLLRIANPRSDFTLTPQTTIVPVAGGGSATDTVNLASMRGFSGAVNLTCSAASGVTCSLNPASNSLSSGGSAVSVLTLNAPSSTGNGTYNVSVTGIDSSGQFIHTLGLEAIVTGSRVTPAFSIGGTSVTVAKGATTGTNISVTPSGGFTGSVVMTAAVTTSPPGALYPPTLSFGSTTPVSITGATAGTATLTIATTAATTGSLAYPARPGARWYTTGGAALACILLFCVPVRRRSWRTMLGMFALFVALAGGVLACGGGGGSSGGGGGGSGGGISGTTSGAYTITVTGTAGSTITTGTVTLTVQ